LNDLLIKTLNAAFSGVRNKNGRDAEILHSPPAAIVAVVEKVGRAEADLKPLAGGGETKSERPDHRNEESRPTAAFEM
jgi:hypothetical protein